MDYYRDERRRRDSRGRYMRDRWYEPRYDDRRYYDDRYEERGYRHDDMRRDRRYDDYDSHEDMEYNDYCLSKHEIHEWMEHLENADGTKGAKFGKEQIVSIARAQGIQFHDFTEDELVMTANMLYSDFCKVMPNTDATVYVRMAKAFLEDPDAIIRGGEKLAKYYDDFVR